VRRVNTVNYVGKKSPKAVGVVIHVNKMKPYHPPGFEEAGKA
jgi:hypothetical protein